MLRRTFLSLAALLPFAPFKQKERKFDWATAVLPTREYEIKNGRITPKPKMLWAVAMAVAPVRPRQWGLFNWYRLEEGKLVAAGSVWALNVSERVLRDTYVQVNDCGGRYVVDAPQFAGSKGQIHTANSDLRAAQDASVSHPPRNFSHTTGSQPAADTTNP